MPSIEIICIGQRKPIHFRNMPFKIYAENKLISHRTPNPLFQSDFDALEGCIYHLVKQPNGAYTAYSLLDEWWDHLRFKPEYVSFIKRMLTKLLAVSSEGRLLFTSDYQFGPSAKRYRRPISIRKFWARNAHNKLRANTLYLLVP